MPRNNRGTININGRDPAQEDWPPTANSQTGVGIYLDGRSAAPAGWNASDPINGPKPPRRQRAIREGLLLDQVGTLLMVERIDDDNYVGDGTRASVALDDPQDHVGTYGAISGLIGGPADVQRQREESLIHLDQWVYLFGDMHVENLAQEATIGLGETISGTQFGAWTIRGSD